MYMGARALTATAGVGFDLMRETISLNGMIENPTLDTQIWRHSFSRTSRVEKLRASSIALPSKRAAGSGSAL